MWALRRGCVRSSGLTHNVNVELEGNILWRKAGIVAARLVIQLAMHGEGAGARRTRGAQLGLNRKRLGVDVQLFARIKGKSDVLARRINDAQRREVVRRFELKGSRNQKLRFRLIRVDVEPIFHPKSQTRFCWLTRRYAYRRCTLESDVSTREPGFIGCKTQGVKHEDCESE
jgi:hypothetical protein